MRASICSALAEKIKAEFNGNSDIYVTNLYESVGTVAMTFDKIMSPLHISVTAGPELRDAQPSRITQADLTVYFRIYVNNSEDPQGIIEQVIADIENFVDMNQRVLYNIMKPRGITQQRQTYKADVTSISTDEGLLSPNGLGEVAVSYLYERDRII